MKTLTQLSKEESAVFDKEFDDMITYVEANAGISEREHVRYWLLAHDRRMAEAAFAATKVEGIAKDWFGNPNPKEAFNAALSEVNNLKREFLK